MFTDGEVIAMLRNVGVDVNCGACMEVAFTGVTTNAHTCQQQLVCAQMSATEHSVEQVSAAHKENSHSVSLSSQAERGKKDGAALGKVYGECEWSIDDDDQCGDRWQASCGADWVFPEGGPAENKMKFCPECGKSLTLVGGKITERE